MPGYILHLTSAQIVLNMIEERAHTKFDAKLKNDFFVGNLLPDTVRDKTASHFRNPRYSDQMIEYPDLDMFLNKYKYLLGDISCLGYYFHLYIDCKFFTEYLPSIVTLQNADGQVVTKRDEVAQVEIKRNGQQIPRQQFFSKDYYYGDYTRMNTYLVDKYHLPLQLNTKVENPGIEEVDYADVEKVLEELQWYLGVPVEAVKELRVFEIETLIHSLEKAALDFIECL